MCSKSLAQMLQKQLSLQDAIPNSMTSCPFSVIWKMPGNRMRSVALTMKLAETESQNTYEYHFAKVSQLPITLVHSLIFSIL